MQDGIYFENAALLPQGDAVYKKAAEETGAEALFVSDETYKRYVAGFLTEGGFAVAPLCLPMRAISKRRKNGLCRSA